MKFHKITVYTHGSENASSLSTQTTWDDQGISKEGGRTIGTLDSEVQQRAPRLSVLSGYYMYSRCLARVGARAAAQRPAVRAVHDAALPRDLEEGRRVIVIVIVVAVVVVVVVVIVIISSSNGRRS